MTDATNDPASAAAKAIAQMHANQAKSTGAQAPISGGLNPVSANPVTAPVEPVRPPAHGTVTDAHTLAVGERQLQGQYPQTSEQRGEKTFYHTVPGSTFYTKSGERIEFLGGKLITSDPELLAEMNKIADKPGSPVYTKRDTGPVPAVTQGNPVDEIQRQAADAMRQLEQQRARNT